MRSRGERGYFRLLTSQLEMHLYTSSVQVVFDVVFLLTSQRFCRFARRDFQWYALPALIPDCRHSESLMRGTLGHNCTIQSVAFHCA